MTLRPIDPIKPLTSAPKPHELKNLKDRLIVQRKYDGARATCMITDKGPQMWSRNVSVSGNRISYTRKLPHIVEELSAWSLPVGTILDGELVSFRGGELETFNDIHSATNGHDERCVRFQQENGHMTWMVFDVVYFRGEPVYNLPLQQRLALLDMLFEINPNMLWVEKVETSLLDQTIEELRKEAEEREFEGYVIKNLDSTYAYKGSYGKAQRPRETWWKVKPQRFADVIITGFEYGNNGISDAVGSLTCEQYVDGEIVRVCNVGSALTSQNRLEYLDLTFPRVGIVQYAERNESGKLLQPVWRGFREDKRPDECIAEDE